MQFFCPSYEANHDGDVGDHGDLLYGWLTPSQIHHKQFFCRSYSAALIDLTSVLSRVCMMWLLLIDHLEDETMRIDGVHHYQHSHQYQDRESMRWIRSLTALSPSLTSWPSSRFSHALNPSSQGLPSGFGDEILWHNYVSTKYVTWRWRQSWVRH